MSIRSNTREEVRTVPKERVPPVWVRFVFRFWESATQRVMSLTLFGMLSGLAVDILIAARLGTGQTADALIIALSLPLLIDTVTREGTRLSMIPFVMERQITQTEERHHDFLSSIFNTAIFGGIILLTLGWMLTPWIVSAIGPGLSPSGKADAVLLMRICMPLVVFAMAATILSVHLNSRRCFNLVAMRNSVIPIVVIFFIVIAWNRENILPWIATAYLVGFLGFVSILWIGARKTGYRYRWSARMARKDRQGLRNAVMLPILAFAVRQGTRLIERMLASLIVVGGVASYYFAFRIFSAVQSLVGATIATTSLPAMADRDLEGDKSKLSEILKKSLMRVLVLSLILTGVLFVLHVQIIQWIYGWGSFGPASVRQTSQVLLCLGTGLVFFCLVPVLQSGLYAQRAYKTIFVNMTTVACINVVLAWLFSAWWGLLGIALSVSVSATVEAVNLVFLLHRTGISLLGRMKHGAI